MTGWVSTVTATTTLTQPLDQSDIETYASNLAEYYGVDASDVEVETMYSTSGTMSISIPDGVSEDSLVDAIAESIAESIGIHPQEVQVVIDMETGAVEFAITSDDYESSAGHQFDLDNDLKRESIIARIEDALPTVEVEEYGVSDDVTIKYPEGKQIKVRIQIN